LDSSASEMLERRVRERPPRSGCRKEKRGNTAEVDRDGCRGGKKGQGMPGFPLVTCSNERGREEKDFAVEGKIAIIVQRPGKGREKGGEGQS